MSLARLEKCVYIIINGPTEGPLKSHLAILPVLLKAGSLRKPLQRGALHERTLIAL